MKYVFLRLLDSAWFLPLLFLFLIIRGGVKGLDDSVFWLSKGREGRLLKGRTYLLFIITTVTV